MRIAQNEILKHFRLSRTVSNGSLIAGTSHWTFISLKLECIFYGLNKKGYITQTAKGKSKKVESAQWNIRIECNFSLYWLCLTYYAWQKSFSQGRYHKSVYREKDACNLEMPNISKDTVFVKKKYNFLYFHFVEG